MLSTYHILWLALNLARLSAFLLHSYYFTKVKSKAISKRIIKISDKIKKSFLLILSATFLLKGGKHSTVIVFLIKIILYVLTYKKYKFKKTKKKKVNRKLIISNTFFFIFNLLKYYC